MGLDEQKLRRLYEKEKRSSAEVGRVLKCSERKVSYWLEKYGIHKRSISEAIYIKHNPHGDPFRWREPTNLYEAELKGLGLGIYWGEGAKRNKTSLRLGNTDSGLIKKFIDFLEVLCGVKRGKLRFSLQVFNDTDPKIAQVFWCKQLGIHDRQFSKTTIIPSRGVGTYKHKNENGVLMLYVHNKKLRDIICNKLWGAITFD
ncbi:MAG: hypothetical protein HY454_00270 [Parcubacteria group bacterium]|nr:hypothetical protein [Parcubacteria group bacterium]